MATQSISAQIQRLARMTVKELQEEHVRLYGTETRSRHKQQLFRRLAWRIQELAYGGLSERAMKRAEEIADDADARFLPPRSSSGGCNGPHEVVPVRVPSSKPYLAPGTVLRREYRGQMHEVLVLDDGKFEYQGKVFRSLSGIAKAITGSIWSGPLFFGLRRRERP